LFLFFFLSFFTSFFLSYSFFFLSPFLSLYICISPKLKDKIKEIEIMLLKECSKVEKQRVRNRTFTQQAQSYFELTEEKGVGVLEDI
jgi:predicted membrane protein